jgi:hypothetical protein
MLCDYKFEVTNNKSLKIKITNTKTGLIYFDIFTEENGISITYLKKVFDKVFENYVNEEQKLFSDSKEFIEYYNNEEDKIFINIIEKENYAEINFCDKYFDQHFDIIINKSDEVLDINKLNLEKPMDDIKDNLNKKYELLLHEITLLKKENELIKQNLENIYDGLYVPIIIFENNNIVFCEKNIETLEITIENSSGFKINNSGNYNSDGKINKNNFNSLTKLKKFIINSAIPTNYDKFYKSILDFRNMKNTMITEIILNNVPFIDFTGIEQLKYLESIKINDFKPVIKKKNRPTEININFEDLKNTKIKEIILSNVNEIDISGIVELKYLQTLKINDVDYSK